MTDDELLKEFCSKMGIEKCYFVAMTKDGSWIQKRIGLNYIELVGICECVKHQGLKESEKMKSKARVHVA